MIVRNAKIAAAAGLHARPAAILAAAASTYDFEITLTPQGSGAGEEVDAASVLSLMSLGIEHGETVTLSAYGPDAEEALEHLCRILETDHDVS